MMMNKFRDRLGSIPRIERLRYARDVMEAGYVLLGRWGRRRDAGALLDSATRPLDERCGSQPQSAGEAGSITDP